MTYFWYNILSYGKTTMYKPRIPFIYSRFVYISFLNEEPEK